ncbi:MAG: aromatic ring-opening dioxygenase subunit LigA [Steroidobacteraceae bacterium]
MSAYALQKLIREVNRSSEVREIFFEAPERLMARYELSPAERAALLAKDYGALYRLGVHGLLLRPFSILHSTSEQDYLVAIRAEGKQ